MTFCSIILRQLHEILNSAITGKKKIALNKHAIMDYVIAINTRSAINWCKFIAVVTLFHEIQNWTQRYDCPIALTANYYENWARYSLLLLIAITERRKKNPCIKDIHGPKLLAIEISHYIYSQHAQICPFTFEETGVSFRDNN